VDAPEDSRVPQAQKRLLEATRAALIAVAADVKAGLLETVGVRSSLVEAERSSVVIELPPGTDTEQIARAIDMENVEAWRDDEGHVHVGIGPWYSTKDVDQAVLSIIKVVHVMLGLHASDSPPPKGLLQKILTSMAEVIAVQKREAEKKDPPTN
jgi:hypothetical protein